MISLRNQDPMVLGVVQTQTKGGVVLMLLSFFTLAGVVLDSPVPRVAIHASAEWM